MSKGDSRQITLIRLTDEELKICQACPYWVELNGQKLCYKEDYKDCHIKECKAFKK